MENSKNSSSTKHGISHYLILSGIFALFMALAAFLLTMLGGVISNA